MRKDRVWMKFKKEDFNQLMGVLSKQMERYSEIEAQNLNLKADIKDEKECLLDLQNKIWRYSHFEKESELITMDMFPSEVKNLFWTFLLNSFHEHDYTNESYFDEYSKKHEKCIYKGNKLSKGAIQELFPMEVNREEADAGEKIRLRNDEQKVEIDFILDGHLEQGYGYKNFKAYNRDVYETSYISEYGYEEYKKKIQEAINHYNKNEFTLEELADSVKEAEKDNGIY